MIKEANNITIAKLVAYYLGSDPGVSTIADACITCKLSSRRSGVPEDAIACRYTIEHPTQSWSIAVRAVWRQGALLCPTATHTVIETYFDDADIGCADSVQLLVNDWLQSLPL